MNTNGRNCVRQSPTTSAPSRFHKFINGLVDWMVLALFFVVLVIWASFAFAASYLLSFLNYLERVFDKRIFGHKWIHKQNS